MTDAQTPKITTCHDCLCHQTVGVRGCGCQARLVRSHAQLYCPKLGKRGQPATRCPGFKQVPEYEFEGAEADA